MLTPDAFFVIDKMQVVLPGFGLTQQGFEGVFQFKTFGVFRAKVLHGFWAEKGVPVGEGAA